MHETCPCVLATEWKVKQIILKTIVSLTLSAINFQKIYAIEHHVSLSPSVLNNGKGKRYTFSLGTKHQVTTKKCNLSV